jgi:hypothetical protein
MHPTFQHRRFLFKCPRLSKTRQGSRWLRQVLVEIAHVASKTKKTSLAAQYRRIAARRGKKRALIAVGHPIVTIVYPLLIRQQPYQDLGRRTVTNGHNNGSSDGSCSG